MDDIGAVSMATCKHLPEAAFMERFPHCFRHFICTSNLPASSRGGRHRRVIEEFSAFGTRCSFHSLVRSNHILQ
jgi:hypothetical protein